ncbi:methyltransferase domain-containing protein [Aminipila sp.]|uniref:methyltransferase domain-containing protein n=1 Tax=Aminipila sp. TaxID=2060095 RepID=UPI00289AB4E5|nr:methyltransferase domain-containing protein [Aminipila sp.]
MILVISKNDESQRVYCVVCNGESKVYRTFSRNNGQDLLNYFICESCGSIFIEPPIIELMDNGQNIIDYDDNYWTMETKSAKKRCFSICLARMAEAIFYTQIKIDKFLDIGTGTGLFLDAIQLYLPNKADRFYGVEKYPPTKGEKTKSPNYYTCDYNQLGEKFDAGMCIEVVEHLTPKMLKSLFTDISQISNEGALYIINTGLAQYTDLEDPNYIDPYVRGHIMSYSIKGLDFLLSDIGFTVHEIRGKTWAIAIEYKRGNRDEDITDRIWRVLPDNLELLNDSQMGSVLQILGRESVRAYL